MSLSHALVRHFDDPLLLGQLPLPQLGQRCARHPRLRVTSGLWQRLQARTVYGRPQAFSRRVDFHALTPRVCRTGGYANRTHAAADGLPSRSVMNSIDQPGGAKFG
jgi:hypothetical protein